jgi:protein SCO1/2
MLVASLALLVGLARPAFAQNAPRPVSTDQSFNQLPPILEDVGIEDKPGAELPRDVRLTGSDGRSFVLGEYMDAEKPLVLVLAYYRCPMLCSMVLRGLDKAIEGMTKQPGADYRVLVVSFDDRDTVEVAHDKRANYLGEMNKTALEVASYEFAIGGKDEVRRIADAVGFHYKWDPTQDQFAHAAGIFVITPKGKLSQTFTGIQFDPADVDKAIVEADKETWHSPLKSALLYCFNYDPKRGHYVPVVMNIMKVCGAITIAVVAFIVFRLVRGERGRAARDAAVAAGEGTEPDSTDHAPHVKALS